jgi:hypothetical protein
MLRSSSNLFRVVGTVLALAFAFATSLRAEFLEKIQNALSLDAPEQQFHLQLSGLIDLETYFIDTPAPALIYTDDDILFNPRLTFFLDAQLGSHIYFFAQTRVDRGFDPTDSGPQIRLDEYFVRYHPLKNLNVQIGQFATVVGNWVQRHDSWQNPFINAPLPYENLTGLWDVAAPEDVDKLFQWSHVPAYDNGDYSDKILRLPVIWGPDYGSGVAVTGSYANFDYAAEMKNTSLSARPDRWSITENGFGHPSFNARIGYRPNETWNMGLSASAGPYLVSEASPTLPDGHGISDYREFVLGQDISFAWHHWQLWAEFFETRFQVPVIGDADVFSYYIEAKYKFTPQLFGALRWNQQFFGTINDEGEWAKWGNDISRIDAAIGYRFTDYLQGKLQYSFSHEDSKQQGENLVAAQMTLKF